MPWDRRFIAAIEQAIANPAETSTLQSYAAGDDWSERVKAILSHLG